MATNLRADTKENGAACRLIVCAGMIRSGSTWLFNAVRLIAQAHNIPYTAHWVQDRVKRPIHGAAEILKIHDFDRAIAMSADLVLLTHRDPRDIARSVLDMGWCDNVDTLTQTVADACANHEFWSRHTSLDLRYEEFVQDSELTLMRLGVALGWEIDASTAHAIANELDGLTAVDGGNSYDPTTLLHNKHRFGGHVGSWRNALSSEFVSAIQSACERWMDAKGYERTIAIVSSQT